MLKYAQGCHNAGGYKFRCQSCHGTGSKTEGRKVVSSCKACDGFGFKNVACDSCGGMGGKEKQSTSRLTSQLASLMAIN